MVLVSMKGAVSSINGSVKIYIQFAMWKKKRICAMVSNFNVGSGTGKGLEEEGGGGVRIQASASMFPSEAMLE